MSNNTFLNPSLNLDSLFPTLNDESFLQFLKEYYKFLQSTKISLENVSGTYVKGETVVGLKSRAFGTILAIGENELIVLMQTEKPLDSTERLTGSTSGATGIITGIKDNVIRESGRLKQARSQYVSGDEFFQLLKDEVNRGYPSSSEADRRALYNRIRELFESKSTEEAYRFLFKAFFDENVEIRFPGDDLLRVSDGKFDQTSLIRCVPENTHPFPEGTVFDFLNKTVRGEQSGAIGQCVNVLVSFLGGIRFAELQLKLVSGEFVPGETVTAVEQPRLSTTTFGLIGDINIIDRGSGYSVGDLFTITGDGAEAIAEVFSISQAPIDKLIENEVGIGYRLNQRATIDNTNTGGGGLIVQVTGLSNTYTVTDGSNNYTVGDISRISIVNRGSGYVRVPRVILVDTTIKTLGLLSSRLIRIDDPGENYSVGDTLTFTGGSGINATGTVASVGTTTSSLYGEDSILFEDGFILTQEENIEGIFSAIKNEEWANEGPILRLELTNFGSGYTSTNLPTVTIEPSGTANGTNATFSVIDVQGSSANVVVDVANNTVGIGSIRFINIINPGLNYSFANVDASQIGDGNAILEPDISGISVNLGTYLNDDGKANFKIIQDSLFYQDFSYVIRSGLIIDAYKELVKETVHPAGLEFFGEIVITSLISLRADFRSQIDQSARPLAISTFVSLFPVGVSIPPTAQAIELEITPTVIEQSVNALDFNPLEREIPLEKFDQSLEFKREIVNNLYLYIDVSLFPSFSDVTTGQLPTVPTELDYILAGMSGIIDTNREYQIKIAPIPMEQPLAVRDFNIRRIEINPLLDLSAEVELVKRDLFTADQYGETRLAFFAENTIESLQTTTFNDFTDLEPEIVEFKKADSNGLEIDIELVSTEVKAEADSNSNAFGTKRQIPLLVVTPLVSAIDEIVNRLEIYLDASAQIVFNDVSIAETSISDIVVKVQSGKVTTTVDTAIEYNVEVNLLADQKVSVRQFNVDRIDIVKDIDLNIKTITEYEYDIFTKAISTRYYKDEILVDYQSTQILEFQSEPLNGLITTPLRSRGFDKAFFEVDLELPLVTVAALVQSTRVFVDRLNIPALGLGTTTIDATVSFEGTSYEIETLPQFVQFAPKVIPQDTGRVKTLNFVVPPVRANINSLLDSIRVTLEQIDVAPIPRMKLEIDVPPGFASPFKELFKDLSINSLQSTTVETVQNQTFDDRYLRYQSLSTTDIDYRIEILQYLDSRMRFYSEVLTMTNREMTVEIDVFGEVTLAAVTPQEVIIIYAIAPSAINVANSVRDFNIREIDINLYLDSRMRFYSEVLTMTNREMTTEIDISLYIKVAGDAARTAIVKFSYDPSLTQVLGGVRDFNIREIEILPYLDSRMRFYSEILEMTNRESTLEIDVIAEKVEVSTTHTKIFESFYPQVQIRDLELSRFADQTIDSFDDPSNSFFTLVEDVTFTKEVSRTAYEIDIEPLVQVTPLVVPTEDHLGNTEREILLYIDSRMRFYSEILEMTNREMTVDVDLFSFTNVASVAPQKAVINYIIIPEVIDVAGSVRNFNIREIDINPYLDMRMSFYSEILEMTNRVHTTEIDIKSGTSVNIEIIPTSYEIDIISNSNKLFANQRFEFFSEDSIEKYASNTFEDIINPSSNFVKPTIEITNIILLYLDSRMRFYSEVLTMTNRESTLEIDVIAEKVNLLVDTTDRKSVGSIIIEPNVINMSLNSTFSNDKLSLLANIKLEEFSENTFVEISPVDKNFTREINLKIDLPLLSITPLFYSEVVLLESRLATTEIDLFSFTNTSAVGFKRADIDFVVKSEIALPLDFDRQIVLDINPYVDSRMRFYTEILTMSNREMTVEIDVFSSTSIAAVGFKKADIDFVINSKVLVASFKTWDSRFINELAVELLQDYADLVIGETYPFDTTVSQETVINILPYIDSRMRFYTEILTMTNREMTVELEVFSSTSIAAVGFKEADIDFQVISSTNVPANIGSTKEIDITPTKLDSTIQTQLEFEVDLYEKTDFAAVEVQRADIDYVLKPKLLIAPVRIWINEFIDTIADDQIGKYSEFSLDDSAPFESIFSKELRVSVPLYMDSRMAFYSEILEMTNGIRTTEIEISTFVDDVAVKAPPTDIDYIIKPFVDMSAELAFPREIKISLHKEVVGGLNNRAIEVESVSRINNSSEFKEINVDCVIDQYVDATTSITFPREIETFSITNVASVKPEKFSVDFENNPLLTSIPVSIKDFTVREIDIGLPPRILFGEELIRSYKDKTIGEYESFAFGGFGDLNITPLKNYREILLKVEPNKTDSTLNFDEEVVEKTIEPDQISVSSNHVKEITEEIYNFGDVLLEVIAENQISEYEDTQFVSDTDFVTEKLDALTKYQLQISDTNKFGAEFAIKDVLYNERLVWSLKNDSIESLSDQSLDDVFANKNVTKNEFISGTVSFIDPGFAGLQLIRYRDDSLESLENDAIEDESGLKVLGVGINTTFTDDFLVGDALITPTEKFLVTNVANNEYLEINVNPEENYDDVSVYREYFV